MAESELTIDALRGQTPEELKAKVDSLRNEIWQFRQKIRTGTEQRFHRIRAMKKDIARIQTVLQEKQLAQ